MAECIIPRRGMPVWESGSRLPSALQEVEYLTSTGQQYINTGIIATSAMRGYEVRTRVKSDSTDGFVLGSETSWLKNSFDLRVMPAPSIWFVINNNWSAILDVTTTDWHKYRYYDKKSYIDDEEVAASYSYQTFNGNTYPIYIFANNRGGSVNEKYTGDIAETILFNDDEISFIPCFVKSGETFEGYKGTASQGQVASGTAGMYDLVNHRFQINAGNGSFITGEPV